MRASVKWLVWGPIVVVLIGIVTAVLFPVFGRARHKAYSPAMVSRFAGVTEEATAHEPMSGSAADAAKSPALISEAAAATIDRQIIYKVSMSLEAKSSTAARDEIEALTLEVGGYVSDTESWVAEAGQRYVTITVRVPTKRFQQVISRVRTLGEVKQESIDAQDVTEEFVDIEARLRVLRQTEQRLLDLLKRSGKLADLLQIERELAQRRTEIEQVEGRLRYLKDRVGYSTITISIREAGSAAVAPSGRYDVVFHLRSAYLVLVRLVQGILTTLIYLVIDGAVLWVPAVVLIWIFVRRQRARSRQ